MGIVQGFSDVLCPPNLAINGGFQINQRGNFSSWTQAFANDYVSDCWYIYNPTIDFLECENDRNSSAAGSGRSLRFRGYGKKGQTVTVYSRAPIVTSLVNSLWTSAVRVSSSSTSVPLQAYSFPNDSGGSYLYIKYANVSATNISDTAVMIRQSASNQYLSLGNAPAIGFTLFADGEFWVEFRSFMVLAGAYKNPPLEAPVNYADDLLRCKRYYQSCWIDSSRMWAKYNTSHAILGVRHNFEVQMAGTPTISFPSSNFLAYTGSGSQVAANESTVSSVSPSSTGFMWYFANINATNSAYLYTNGGGASAQAICVV